MEFSNLTSLILNEASKNDEKILDDIEKDNFEMEFQDTLAGLEKCNCCLTVDAVPVMKGECGECDESCKESYMIDYDILYKFSEQNNYNDEVDALQDICEENSINVEDVIVVAECDSINKGLLANASKNGMYGVARRYCCGLCNLLNHGIRVGKRS